MINGETDHVTDNNFLYLVASLSTAAMQQLGKLMDPTTGKTSIRLEGARFSIDLLESLERKTRGNLSEEEQRTLSQTLTMLRLNYVETAASEEKKTQKKEDAAETAPSSSETGE